MAIPASFGALQAALAIKEQRAPRLDGKAACAGARSSSQSCESRSPAHRSAFLVRLGDLHHGQAPFEHGARGVFVAQRASISAPGALDRRVGAFHRLDGHAGLRRHHHRLPDVESGHGPRHAQPVLDILALFLVRRARSVSTPSCASSGSRKAVELISSMPSSPSTLATAPSSMSVLRVRRFSSSLASRQSGRMLRENLLVLHLPGHHGLLHAFFVKGLDQPRQLAQRKPVDGDAAVAPRALVDLRVGLFADGRDHHGEPLRPRRIQQQKRKAAVAGDQAEFHCLLDHPALAALDEPDQQRHVFALHARASSRAPAWCSASQPAAAGKPSAARCSRSGENPRRSSPTLFIPKALFSRREEVSENGSTSWVTIVPPPMNAYLPTVQNWCTGLNAPTVA